MSAAGEHRGSVLFPALLPMAAGLAVRPVTGSGAGFAFNGEIVAAGKSIVADAFNAVRDCYAF